MNAGRSSDSRKKNGYPFANHGFPFLSRNGRHANFFHGGLELGAHLRSLNALVSLQDKRS